MKDSKSKMHRYQISAIAMAALLSACAIEPPTPPSKTFHEQVTALSQSGILLSTILPAGHPRAVADNPALCQTQSCTVTGRGTYVGKGMVVTAAHVVSMIDPGEWLRLDIWTSNGGGELLWRAPDWSRGHNDLALVRVGDALLRTAVRGDLLKPGVPEIRPTPICDAVPQQPTAVFVVGYETVFATTLSYNRFSGEYNLSNQVLPGISGSGVIDAEKKCLLAVVSAQNSSEFALDRLDDGTASGGMRQTLVTPIDKTVFAKMMQAVQNGE